MRIIYAFLSIFVICLLVQTKNSPDIVEIHVSESFMGIEWPGSPYWDTIRVEKNINNSQCQVSESYYMDFLKLYPEKKGFEFGYLFVEIRKFIKSRAIKVIQDTLDNPTLNSGYSLSFVLKGFLIQSTIEVHGSSGVLIVCGNPKKK
jgi:hypothetical protein